MTEDEAKTKWCPFVRSGDRGAIYQDTAKGDVAPGIACIGSVCMAWRTVPKPEQVGANPYIMRTIFDGFCGLAGKP